MHDHKFSRRKLLQRLAAAPLASAALVARGDDAAIKKRIYIAADDHTDYMWTADEATYRRAFLQMIDHYLDLADQTDDHPSDWQSRWNCDGLQWFHEFEQHRDANQVARLLSRVKSGHISFPMTLLVCCFGGMPTEAVLRGMYYGGHVERQYNLRLSMAVAMENQAIPYGLGMLWAGCGIKHSWKGICGCATKMKYNGGRRKHDVYWWVGPDGSRILMKWYSMTAPIGEGIHGNQGPGGYAEARYAEQAIEFVDRDPGFNQRNPHSVIGLFGQGWDDLKTVVPLNDPRNSFPAVARRMSNDQRRVIVSNEHDYFRDMQATHGDELPEVSCAFGNEWDLYCASLSEVSASVKRATEKLRNAEAMAALVSKLQPDFADDLKTMRDQAWIAYGMYWEHDWTADGPISRDQRAAWQRKVATQITSYADQLHRRAIETLGKRLKKRHDRHVYEVLVFNSLSWDRSDYVDILIDRGGDIIQDIGNDLVVTDEETGKVAAGQFIKVDGKLFYRFLATDVPACGYRRYKIHDIDSMWADHAIKTTDDTIESPLHRLKLGKNGSITDWHSKRLGVDLIVDGEPANDLGPGSGSISVESSGRVSTTLRIDVPGPIARTTRFTLFEKLDRIEIDNTITQNFSGVEAWRYAFNLDSPRTIHEEVGAVIHAASLSQGGDYADENARTDWLTMNHFITIHDDSAAITISNRDCQFFHLGEKIEDQMDSQSNVIHALAGGQVDGPELGIPDQGGDTRFTQRFALRCGNAANRAESMRFALAHQNPLAVGLIQGEEEGALNANTFSMLRVESRSVMAWTVKPHEDGAEQGTIVRLWNLSDKESEYALRMYRPIRSCVETTHVETDLRDVPVTNGAVEGTLAPGAMRTLRIL